VPYYLAMPHKYLILINLDSYSSIWMDFMVFGKKNVWLNICSMVCISIIIWVKHIGLLCDKKNILRIYIYGTIH